MYEAGVHTNGLPGQARYGCGGEGEWVDQEVVEREERMWEVRVDRCKRARGWSPKQKSGGKERSGRRE